MNKFARLFLAYSLAFAGLNISAGLFEDGVDFGIGLVVGVTPLATTFFGNLIDNNSRLSGWSLAKLVAIYSHFDQSQKQNKGAIDLAALEALWINQLRAHIK